MNNYLRVLIMCISYIAILAILRWATSQPVDFYTSDWVWFFGYSTLAEIYYLKDRLPK